jgi:hypothetical protein
MLMLGENKQGVAVVLSICHLARVRSSSYTKLISEWIMMDKN